MFIWFNVNETLWYKISFILYLKKEYRSFQLFRLETIISIEDLLQYGIQNLQIWFITLFVELISYFAIQVTESYDTQTCQSCGTKLAEYFCPKCKHFTGVEKKPYHCDKCGICRIHKDKSFHCEVCNVCLDKRLEGKHKCRPDSGHDECCICLEVCMMSFRTIKEN